MPHITRVEAQGAKYQIVDLADNSTTVFSGPGVFWGFGVTVATSAHAFEVKDGAVIIHSVLASQPIGAEGEKGFGIRVETSLVIDPNDAATGTIVVYYRKD
jgi:hypothetical protein